MDEIILNDLIVAENLTLGYENVNIIENVSFNIKPNDFVIITGPSGSGKSTLLKSFYGDLAIKSGDLKVCRWNLNGISKTQLRDLRREIGVIFQDYKLIKEWTIEKNIMLPLIIKNYDKSSCEAQAEKLLKTCWFGSKIGKYPLELSGGEQQRVATVRAMAHNPRIIIADEPTGNLDEFSSEIIWNLLYSAKQLWGASVVVVTHKKPSMLRFAYRHLTIENGKIKEL